MFQKKIKNTTNVILYNLVNTGIAGLLSLNYRYKFVSHDSVWASISYTGHKIFSYRESNKHNTVAIIKSQLGTL